MENTLLLKPSSAYSTSNRTMSLVTPRGRPRRVWVRLPGRTPTSFHVSSNDLIDDLKYMITTKFPNSIKSHYDAADLVIKVPLVNTPTSPRTNMAFRSKQDQNTSINTPSPLYPNGNTPTSILKSAILPPISQSSPLGTGYPPSANASSIDLGNDRPSSVNSAQDQSKTIYLELQPDLYVWTVMDMYFGEGQTIQHAFLIDVADGLIKGQHVNNLSDSLVRSQPMDDTRANSYSNSNTNTIPNSMILSAPLPTPKPGKSHLLNPPTSKFHSNNGRVIGNILESSISPFETPSKIAVLGDGKVPPPRFRNQSLNESSTPNSAIIMFPGDDKTDRSKVHKQSKSLFSLNRASSSDPSAKKSHGLNVNTSSSNDDINNDNKRTKQTSIHPNQIELSVTAPSPSVVTSAIGNLLTGTSSASLNSTANTITPTTATDIHSNLSNVTINNTNGASSPIGYTPKDVTKSKLDHRIHPLKGVAKILNHLNVLVVEDNLVNQRIMARHLKSCNVQYDIAKTGKEALEKWKEGGFHLCFMDIQIPVMSGIEVTKEIRRLERLHRIGQFAMGVKRNDRDSESPGSGSNDDSDILKDKMSVDNIDDHLDLTLFRSPIIIVALTASSSVADQQNALAAGCNDFLTKPVQLKWLKNKLTEWGCMQALINFDYFRDEQ